MLMMASVAYEELFKIRDYHRCKTLASLMYPPLAHPKSLG
jgi:hypothetical protein